MRNINVNTGDIQSRRLPIIKWISNIKIWNLRFFKAYYNRPNSDCAIIGKRCTLIVIINSGLCESAKKACCARLVRRDSASRAEV